MSDVLRELNRELAMRKKCYPKWVTDGRLSRAVADHRIAMIEKAIAAIESIEPQQQQLFQSPDGEESIGA